MTNPYLPHRWRTRTGHKRYEWRKGDLFQNGKHCQPMAGLWNWSCRLYPPHRSVFFTFFLSESLQMSYRPIHSRSTKHQFLDSTKSWQKRCEDDLHCSLFHSIGTSRDSSLSPLVSFDTSTSICCDSSFCFSSTSVSISLPPHQRLVWFSPQVYWRTGPLNKY